MQVVSANWKVSFVESQRQLIASLLGPMDAHVYGRVPHGMHHQRMSLEAGQAHRHPAPDRMLRRSITDLDLGMGMVVPHTRRLSGADDGRGGVLGRQSLDAKRPIHVAPWVEVGDGVTRDRLRSMGATAEEVAAWQLGGIATAGHCARLSTVVSEGTGDLTATDLTNVMGTASGSHSADPTSAGSRGSETTLSAAATQLLPDASTPLSAAAARDQATPSDVDPDRISPVGSDGRASSGPDRNSGGNRSSIGDRSSAGRSSTGSGMNRHMKHQGSHYSGAGPASYSRGASNSKNLPQLAVRTELRRVSFNRHSLFMVTPKSTAMSRNNSERSEMTDGELFSGPMPLAHAAASTGVGGLLLTRMVQSMGEDPYGSYNSTRSRPRHSNDHQQYMPAQLQYQQYSMGHYRQYSRAVDPATGAVVAATASGENSAANSGTLASMSEYDPAALAATIAAATGHPPSSIGVTPTGTTPTSFGMPMVPGHPHHHRGFNALMSQEAGYSQHATGYSHHAAGYSQHTPGYSQQDSMQHDDPATSGYPMSMQAHMDPMGMHMGFMGMYGHAVDLEVELHKDVLLVKVPPGLVVLPVM